MKQQDVSHALLRNAGPLGHEGRAASGDHAVLKLWLRLLATTTEIENEVRRRLREQFGISLARFDYLSQLYRVPGGMKMRELSRFLMVTGGNVTGLTDELEREGFVVREDSPTDRRAWIVRLTDKGRDFFPAYVALKGWADRWMTGPEGPLVVLQEAETGREVTAPPLLGGDGAPLTPEAVRVLPGPGASAGMRARFAPSGSDPLAAREAEDA